MDDTPNARVSTAPQPQTPEVVWNSNRYRGFPLSTLKFKYVTMETGTIIWPYSDLVFHRDIARGAQREAPNRVLSAGFVDIKDGQVRAYGRSESLGIGSDPLDSQAIAKMLGMQAAATHA